MTTVWILRESFLAYERFYGVFETKEKAMAGREGWEPIKRKLPPYMWDDADPFDSPGGAHSTMINGNLWVVEPMDVR